jgi:hypothetical protein
VPVATTDVHEKLSVLNTRARGVHVLFEWEHIEPALLPYPLKGHVLVECLLVPWSLRQPFEKV